MTTNNGVASSPTPASIGALAASNNLSDVASATTARSNLGLAQAASLLAFAAPPAGGVAVHAAFVSNAGTITTGFTQPTIPRVLQCVFAAAWDGGVVTVTGIDQFGNVAADTFTTGGAGDTIVGVVAFASVTSIAHSLTGLGVLHATVQTAAPLGAGVALLSTVSIEVVDGTMVEAATLSTAYSTIEMGTAPNGVHNYAVLVVAGS